jgi:hypothetical protein
MSVEENRDIKKTIRKNALKVLKPVVKTVMILVIYVLLMRSLAPASAIIPGLPEMIQTFIVVYLVLMFIGDLSSGTIFQHLFGAARALFVIVYLIASLNSGIVDFTFENVNLIVDLRLFLIIVMLLELLGMASSMIRVVDLLCEKAEKVPELDPGTPI